jgi:4-amino-4-deoxy-L-arabinose transferase-like glycosyltransferase
MPAPLPPPAPAGEARTRGFALPLALLGLIAGAAVLRFGSLSVQSYHHDEVITAMRVIPGSLGRVLHEVKASESNPPLYYVLAWAWAKAFGRDEFQLRSLSALFGTAVVPVAFLIGRQLASRRAGLILAAFVAVNPMLIWYSQEARSYAPLVFFSAVSFYFFLRALEYAEGRDLALWALSSALALCSHYFAAFPVAIEAAWLLLALRSYWRVVLPAVAFPAAVGAALLPLLSGQINATHIDWIEKSPLSTRFLEAGASFLIGETGHVIAEPVRYGYAIVPVLTLVAALVLLTLRGSPQERSSAGVSLVLGLGIPALAGLAAVSGHDYVVERNLLPALLPLVAVVAVGFSTASAWRLGAALAVGLCLYWLAFDVYITRKPNLQRPDLRALSQEIGPAKVPRAVVSWKLAAEPIRWYLPGRVPRMFGGRERVREVDVVSKPSTARRPANLDRSFREVERFRLDRLTLTRYLSKRPMELSFPQLAALHTGFGENAVVLNGPAGWRVSPQVRTRSGEGSGR